MALFFRHSGSIALPVPFNWTGQGQFLPALKIDETIATLWSNILELQQAVADGFSIDDISVDDEVAPTMMIITLSDYRVFNIPLPVAAFNPVGPWTNNTALARLDVIETELGLYWVRVPHTTPLSGDFNPDALDGDGNNLYALLFRLDQVMRWKGDWLALMELKKYNVFKHASGAYIVNIDHTAAATFDPTAEIDEEAVYTQIAGPAYSPIKTVATSTYELSLDDVGYYIRFTHVDGCVVAFPADVEFPVNSAIHMRRTAGPVSFVEDNGFTLNPQRAGYDSTLPYIGATATAKFLSATEADLIAPYGTALVS